MKKALSLILALVMTTLCVANVSAFQSTATIEIGEVSSDIKKEVVPLKEKDWTVCMYMCGTDLETAGSAMRGKRKLDYNVGEDVLVEPWWTDADTCPLRIFCLVLDRSNERKGENT